MRKLNTLVVLPLGADRPANVLPGWCAARPGGSPCGTCPPRSWPRSTAPSAVKPASTWMGEKTWSEPSGSPAACSPTWMRSPACRGGSSSVDSPSLGRFASPPGRYRPVRWCVSHRLESLAPGKQASGRHAEKPFRMRNRRVSELRGPPWPVRTDRHEAFGTACAISISREKSVPTSSAPRSLTSDSPFRFTD